MFKGSNITSANLGKVKGLLVGINYTDTAYQLGGCINDVLAVQRLIKLSYPDAELELLTDDTFEKPTRDNILKKLTKLVENAKSGDTLIFDYSGHGSQVQDIHGDEADGLDETICPIDFVKSRVVYHKNKRYVVDSQILDDEIKEIISNVPHGARFLMLSDSCHSGHIADLEHDFSNYIGPNIWPNETCAGSEMHVENPVSQNNANLSYSFSPNQTTPVQQSLSTIQANPSNTNKPELVYKIKTKALWVYVKLSNREEVWVMPYNNNLLTDFVNNKYAINLNNHQHDFSQLKAIPNISKTCSTEFQLLSNGDYKVSSEELGINDLIIKNDKSKLVLNQINIYNSQIGMPVGYNAGETHQQQSNSSSENKPNKTNWLNWFTANKDIPQTDVSPVVSARDIKTGKYYHINRLNGTKRVLSMRSPDTCKGGELRIISGCREDQTSADTGVNGACTIAFLDTVRVLGGLKNFLEKIFSHDISEFKLVENTINKYLSNFGFTQHSVFSWDHSHSPRELEAATSSAGTTDYILPIIYRDPVPKDKVKDYVDNALSSSRSSFEYEAVVTEEGNRVKLQINEFRKARNFIE
jgi:Caspase domain